MSEVRYPAIRRTEQIGNATLYLADARNVLPFVTADALVTDPPYGINGGAGSDARKRQKGAYNSFEDTEEYIADICVPIVAGALTATQRGAVTPGNRCLHLYPRAADVGCFYHPAAMAHGPWGFVGFTPILYYGRDFRAGKGALPSSRTVTEAPPKVGHPCPKPLQAWKWLVDKVSQSGEIVFDPFMGSGTTGVACVTMGRKFIGVEMDPAYFEIALNRIHAAQKQGDLLHMAMSSREDECRRIAERISPEPANAE